MSEEKKTEVEEEKKEEEKQEKEEQGSEQEEQKEEKKEDYEEGETVSSAKYNQALRKQREAEAQVKELQKGSEEEENDDEGEEEEKSPEESELATQVKDMQAKMDKTESDSRKASRSAFFESHPEYVSDSEKWQGLLDEIDNSFSPDSPDDYFTQLEKAHRIVAGDEIMNAQIADKQREMANDATSGGDGAQSGASEGEFTAEDRAYMAEWNISEDGMRAAKKKLESGSMQIL